ncbi:hypothetical protein A7A08_01882 [Methyloligella halotolerans]|uniref:Uncharacterized protein n=1 Tax=Methyloligella halotolerans TaxID=1177755 RepID=A0A1E2RY16_9HYPH|nr:hypothetical protein [Methyloligella halotolerans]ODA67136.1 hypothetical protein A7A08_01882 [Methyloligella halotolerans]
MKFEENDPLQEPFDRWQETANPSGAGRAPTDSDANDFTEYAESLLSELEAMAMRLKLEELGASLSLCRNVARLSGRRR